MSTGPGQPGQTDHRPASVRILIGNKQDYDGLFTLPMEFCISNCQPQQTFGFQLAKINSSWFRVKKSIFNRNTEKSNKCSLQKLIAKNIKIFIFQEFPLRVVAFTNTSTGTSIT